MNPEPAVPRALPIPKMSWLSFARDGVVAGALFGVLLAFVVATLPALLVGRIAEALTVLLVVLAVGAAAGLCVAIPSSIVGALVGVATKRLSPTILRSVLIGLGGGFATIPISLILFTYFIRLDPVAPVIAVGTAAALGLAALALRRLRFSERLGNAEG